MENIDLRDIACFGFTIPTKESWMTLASQIKTNGWKNIDKEMFEKSLSNNIKSSYANMISISFKDLDTDQNYLAGFDNIQKLWKLEIPDSPDDALDPADKKAFFKCETFKKVCKRADLFLTKALTLVLDIVMPEIKKGQFIQIDEIKLEAIIDMLDDQKFRSNLKLGKNI